MELSALKTRIPDKLKFLEIPICISRKYHPSCPEVDPLLNLCQPKVDIESEPSFWNFSVDEIIEYVCNSWNFPELKEPFLKNEIDGKGLVFLEADKLPKIGIHNFSVIKELTAEIRKLCKIEPEEPNRGVSLPMRRPHTLFLWYKGRRTGPTAYFMTPTKYYRRINIIRDETTAERRYYALLNHWNRIPPFRSWCPHVTVGGKRRINPMTGTTQRQRPSTKVLPC